MSVRKEFTGEYSEGKRLMKKSFVSICSIVRDCEKNLKRNIPRIELLRELFRDSEVIIFENDSKDDTLKVLRSWEKNSPNIHVFSENYNNPTIPERTISPVNPFFSVSRIEKMVKYRNKYLQYLNKHDVNRNYVIVVDLDISDFFLEGIIHSFGTTTKWDCISANGISLSARLKHQYHDSYALIEHGQIAENQTEESINLNRKRFSTLKSGMPLVHVDSAYGGMAIYKWSSLKGILYSCLINNDPNVQCKSEHVGLHMSMKENGFDQIFINPSMLVKYRSVTFMFLVDKLKRIFIS